MDEPGFHARRQAEREEREARKRGKLGGLVATVPLDDDDEEDRYSKLPLEDVLETPAVPTPAGQTAPLPPPKGRRRMNPHLQLMLGPILRYDTVVNHVYHAYALVVTTDNGSSYETAPSLTLEWDSSGAGLASDFNRKVSLEEQVTEQAVISAVCPGALIYRYQSLAGPQSFWRFKIEIPLGESEQEIFYSVNGGPENSFFVPAFDQNMRTVAHSCNGFSAGVDTTAFNGPSPLWSDVLRSHHEKPFHVLIGGGDQLYCDPLTREPEISAWIEETDGKKKIAAVMTDEMRLALDRFFFNHYCSWFRSGSFGRAIGKIPMLNCCDDHDIIDGFGSYPDDLQSSPVFSTIGARGYFWYLLFQTFVVDDFDSSPAAPPNHRNLSTIIGGPGAWIPSPSHSFLSYLGPQVYILLLDTRAERKKDQICSSITYERVFQAVRQLPPEVDHLIVLLGVPICYPRMGAVETVLESKFNPLTVLAKKGVGLSGFVNKFNKEAELLDDLNDHWCASHHKKERNWVIEEFQKLGLSQHLRITFLSGDVHAAAVSKLHTVKHEDPATDPKYMLQIISSAIVNTPPPNAVLLMVSTLGKKRHKTLHYIDTDEDLLPLFSKDPDGSSRKIETIMGRRNYAVITHASASGELTFDIRVETTQGAGTTKGYPISTPPPRW